MTSLRAWLERRADRLPGGAGRSLVEDSDREIEGFHRPVTDRSLDDARSRSTDVSRYRVAARKLYRAGRTPPDKPWFAAAEERFEGMIDRLLSLVPPPVVVPDFDFAVNLGDYPVRGAPILTAWSRADFGNARIPPVGHWPTDLSVPLDDATIRAHYAFEPDAVSRRWTERRPLVAWRGSATGMYDHTFRWRWLKRLLGVPPGKGIARLDLCRIASAHPDLIDARITGWPQVSDRVRHELEKAYPTAPRVPNSWFLGHRFVVNVDGNVATTSFLTFVGSGSVVLKQDSPYLDWCSRHLESGVHYLPVARDLGDLVSVARDALSEPERSSDIQAAGRAFADEFLTGAAVDHYLLALLDRYATVADADGPSASDPPGRGFIRVS